MTFEFDQVNALCGSVTSVNKFRAEFLVLEERRGKREILGRAVEDEVVMSGSANLPIWDTGVIAVDLDTTTATTRCSDKLGN